MKSIGAMVKQLSGMVETDDLNAWEDEFVQSIFDQTAGGTDTGFLSSAQVNQITKLYSKHFGD